MATVAVRAVDPRTGWLVMLHIIQLSDLHLSNDVLNAPQGRQGQVLANLESALIQTKREYAAEDAEWIVVLSGDIYDSAAMNDDTVRAIFDHLLGILDRTLESPTTLLLPGNHDVRSRGVIRVGGLWPWGNVFEILQRHLQSKPQLNDRVFLYGNEAPSLLWTVPRGSRPVDLAAYDSTYLPYGLFSAGGMVRAQDLLSLLPKLDTPPTPLVLLLHHHLIPTPVADFTLVQSPIRRLLKRLASNADYEEVMQTALGAGSALSALQRLGRPILALHGHKHYPSVRLLSGGAAVVENPDAPPDLGDILLLSAGSAGLVEEYLPGHGLPMPIWPSFNHVQIDRSGVTAHIVVYPPDQDKSSKSPWARPLYSASCDDIHWKPRSFPGPQQQSYGVPTPPRLDRNESAVRIGEGASRLAAARRSLHVERTLVAGPNPRLTEYAESIDCAKDATIRPVSGAKVSEESSHEVLLNTDGSSSYEVSNALYVFADDFAAAHDKRDAPFESIELLNRYHAKETKLSVSGLLSDCHLKPEECFGSVMDLTLGIERPVPLVWASDVATITVSHCPPRHRLRVYWPVKIREGSLMVRFWRAVCRWVVAATALAPERPGFRVPRWLSLVFGLASIGAIVLTGTAYLIASGRAYPTRPAEELTNPIDPARASYLRSLAALPVVPLSPPAREGYAAQKCLVQLVHRQTRVEQQRRNLRLSMARRDWFEARLNAGEPEARKWIAAESAEIDQLGSHVEHLIGNGSSVGSSTGLLILLLGAPILAAYVIARQARRAGLTAGRRREMLVPFVLMGMSTCIGAAYVTYRENVDPLKDSFDQNSLCFFTGSFWPAHLPIAAVGLVVSGALALAWAVSGASKAPAVDLRAPHCGVRPYLEFLEGWCFSATLITGVLTAISLASLASAPTRTGKTLAWIGVSAPVFALAVVVRLILCAHMVRDRYRSAVDGLSDWKNAQPDPTEGFLGLSPWKMPAAFVVAFGIVLKLLESSGAARLFGP